MVAMGFSYNFSIHEALGAYQPEWRCAKRLMLERDVRQTGRRMARKKNPAAVALGRLGGKAKVPKGMHLLPPERRTEIARKAAEKRWKDYRAKQAASGRKKTGA
jgi:hypothetical protein